MLLLMSDLYSTYNLSYFTKSLDWKLKNVQEIRRFKYYFIEKNHECFWFILNLKGSFVSAI